MTAMLFATEEDNDERTHILQTLSRLVAKRVDAAHAFLAVPTNGHWLQLAHGALWALQLCVECATAFGAEDGLEEVCRDMAKLCTRAIRTSLAVVANTAASALEEEEKEEEEDVDVEGKGHRRTPLDVNQGAIGANTSFAAIWEDNKEERTQHMAVQQLVVSAE